MKKKFILFWYLFVSLFFVFQYVHASFFNTPPCTQSFGTYGYATHWSPNSSYLAVGGTNFPNDITIYSWDGINLNQKTTQSFGNGTKAIDWTPDTKFLAVGGNNPTYPLVIYQWDGNSLTLTTSKYHGTEVRATAWNPNGVYLAAGGTWGNNDLAIYSWDGTSVLTLTGSKYHGSAVNGLAWHPDGTKLAVAGNNRFCNLGVYNWNGSALTITTSKHHGSESFAVAWNHAGTQLAVGGNWGNNDVALYTWDGSALTLTTSVSFGNKASTLDWSFDDRYLSVGGDNGTSDLITYELNGSTLKKIYSSQTSYGNGVYSTTWSPYADYLAVAGDNSTSNVNIYGVHGYLNGTKNNVTLPTHYLFSDGGFAQSNVNFTNGCTVLNASKLKVSLLTPFSGGLDLRNTATLQLEDDLHLDANVTLSSGGTIYGQGHAIYLGNDLTIPDNKIMYITSPTIIDGNGHKLVLGNRSQIFIDWGITLTLRNIILKNTYNPPTGNPPVRLNGKASILALDNVELELASNFSFTYGQLFIHNDVLVTGTSQFNFFTSRQSYIDSNSTLYFDIGTTFSFAPYQSTNKDLLYMKDASSVLYLNGSTLAITHTGLRLTRGQLVLDNNITFTSQYLEGNHKQAASNSFVFGNATSGANYDLTIKLLNNARISTTSMIKYNNFY